MRIVKFLKLKNPKRGYYSHHDWRQGLAFKVYYSDDTVSLYSVSGEDTEIANYMKRFGADISEMSDTAIETEVNAKIKPGERPCHICGGTGKIIVPPFEAAKEVA